jgi:hypothetical protein
MKYQDLKSPSKWTSISVFTIRKFIKMGLPHYRIGKKYLVDPDEFKAWFEKNHKVKLEPVNLGLDQIVSNALADTGIPS